MMKSLFVAVARFICGVRARWVGCVPDARQRVYFANHTSNLDALVVWASLPPFVRDLTRPVAARDYWMKSRLRRYLAHNVFNAVLIERKRPTARDNPLTDMLGRIVGPPFADYLSGRRPAGSMVNSRRSRAVCFISPKTVRMWNLFRC